MFITKFVLTLVLFLFCQPAFAAPAYVQSNDNRGSYSYNSATSTVTLGSNVKSGDTIMIGVWWESTTITLSSVTDNCGGTYIFVDNNTVGSTASTSMAYATGSSGSCTITATYSGSATATNIIIAQEVSGVGALDRSTMKYQSLPGTGSDSVTSGNVTTTAKGEYIFGYTACTSNNGPTITAGTGFTLRDVPDPTTEDQIQASSGSIAATFTQSFAFSGMNTGIMTFKPPPTVAAHIAGGSHIGGGKINF